MLLWMAYTYPHRIAIAECVYIRDGIDFIAYVGAVLRYDIFY